MAKSWLHIVGMSRGVNTNEPVRVREREREREVNYSARNQVGGYITIMATSQSALIEAHVPITRHTNRHPSSIDESKQMSGYFILDSSGIVECNSCSLASATLAPNPDNADPMRMLHIVEISTITLSRTACFGGAFILIKTTNGADLVIKAPQLSLARKWSKFLQKCKVQRTSDVIAARCSQKGKAVNTQTGFHWQHCDTFRAKGTAHSTAPEKDISSQCSGTQNCRGGSSGTLAINYRIRRTLTYSKKWASLLAQVSFILTVVVLVGI
jgi:hypothetical protein